MSDPTNPRPTWDYSNTTGTRGRFRLIASFILVTFVLYVGAWLSIANGPVVYYNDGGRNACQRLPGHLSHGTLCRALFAPAFAVDEWLRPRTLELVRAGRGAAAPSQLKPVG